jgi:hypothetical protein
VLFYAELAFIRQFGNQEKYFPTAYRKQASSHSRRSEMTSLHKCPVQLDFGEAAALKNHTQMLRKFMLQTAN